MIAGLNLQSLAQRIQTDAPKKRDFIAGTKGLLFADDGKHIEIPLVNSKPIMMPMNTVFHRQVATHTKVPSDYYERMRVDAPSLLAWNVNHWFEAKPEQRMIRTLDNTARAFLSKSYRPLDNVDLFAHLVPYIVDAGCEIKSAQITDQRLYIQAIYPKIQGEVKVGDVMQSGVVISNSEVGMGSIAVQQLCYRLVCKNGMVMPDQGIRRNHVGRHHHGAGEDLAAELFSDETRRQDDKAFWMKCRDVVRATLSTTRFENVLNRMRAAAGIDIPEPKEAIEITAKHFKLSEDESSKVLAHFAKGGDGSLWGLANAITRTAEDATSYDRAMELEAIGGEAIELKPSFFGDN